MKEKEEKGISTMVVSIGEKGTSQIGRDQAQKIAWSTSKFFFFFLPKWNSK